MSYKALQNAKCKKHIAHCSPLNSTCHDGVLGPLSGRLKQLFHSVSSQTMLYFKLLAFLLVSTLFTGSYSQLLAQTDTFICDNGGFQDNFDYYFGEVATFYLGSNTCTPTDNSSNPVTWTPTTLPSYRQFEIVGSGTDALVGIAKTKFGNKALLLNNPYGHIPNECNGHRNINKIVKRFKVTEENRDFSVWFAAVLENPTSHTNSQPYFHIHCNRAPESDLCFDAHLLECEENYSSEFCEFEKIDVLNWSCHRIKIPANYIDSIAILEISVADCGCNAHFGYAYVDGICEECDGSAMGNAYLFGPNRDTLGLGIDNRTCEGDTIRLCGYFELPTLCGDWELDSLIVPGYEIYNLSIDTPNQTFCFDLPRSSIPDELCHDIYVVLYFGSSVAQLPPISSNSIVICPDDFETYEIEVLRGSCNNNNTPNLLSDDYYFVSLEITNTAGDSWIIERHLDNPIEGESGEYELESGGGDINYNLGPFLIQEGNWDLVIKIGYCEYIYQITAPDFCGACTSLNKTKIFDIECNDPTTPNDPLDDTWTFKIVAYKQGGSQYLFIEGMGSTNHNFNGTYTIQGGLITNGCKKYSLRDPNDGNCTVEIIVCPPKPCSANSECELEVYIDDYECEEDDEFTVDLAVSGAGSGYLCYQVKSVSTNSTLASGSFTNPIGPFDEDVILKLFLCTTSTCSCTPNCFKYIYIPAFDCEEWEGFGNIVERTIGTIPGSFIVLPNPIISNEIMLKSNLLFTEYEWYNSEGKLLMKGQFTGQETKISLNLSPGLYFVRYKDFDGKSKFIKLIKQ